MNYFEGFGFDLQRFTDSATEVTVTSDLLDSATASNKYLNFIDTVLHVSSVSFDTHYQFDRKIQVIMLVGSE